MLFRTDLSGNPSTSREYRHLGRRDMSSGNAILYKLLEFSQRLVRKREVGVVIFVIEATRHDPTMSNRKKARFIHLIRTTEKW